VPLKTHKDDLPAINLTPMIDIVFNLIIFFMVSTRFTELERKVDLTAIRFPSDRANGGISSNSQQVRGLVIQAHGLKWGDEPSRGSTSNGVGLIPNGAGQRSCQRVRQQVADANRIARDQSSTE
jgi:hypothetical protein